MSNDNVRTGRTASLRRQHNSALQIVARIQFAITTYSGPRDAYAIGIALAKLTGVLRIHFAQEDKTLYPYMMTSTNAEAADLAGRFQHEMGGIGAAFDAFTRRWGSSAAIAADFPAFKAESSAIFAALDHRITRENEELYPLADAITYDEVARTA